MRRRPGHRRAAHLLQLQPFQPLLHDVPALRLRLQQVLRGLQLLPQERALLRGGGAVGLCRATCVTGCAVVCHDTPNANVHLGGFLGLLEALLQGLPLQPLRLQCHGGMKSLHRTQIT